MILVEKLENVQNPYARFVTGNYKPRESGTVMKVILRVQPLSVRSKFHRRKLCCVIYYDVTLADESHQIVTDADRAFQE